MDALEALGDHRAHAQEQGALGGPVARAAGPILLARQHDQRHALGSIALGGIEDRDHLSVGEVPGPVAFPVHQLVAQADVGKRPAHHHLVVAAPGPIAVEVRPGNPVLHQVPARGAVLRDVARG